MDRDIFINFDPERVPGPSYVVDIAALDNNLRILKSVQDRTGAKILLAQKAFSMFSVYPLIGQYLSGVCASGLLEARLGREEMNKEVHAYSAAFSDKDMKDLLPLCDHIVFNSFSQWERFQSLVKPYSGKISFGLRINPEHREAEVALYDPSAPHSRLGITRPHFDGKDLSGIEGLHFHNLCEQNSDALERTLDAVEKKFGMFFNGLKWLNFGGGHHITRPDYDIDKLCRLIETYRDRYNVQIYLEPGEAVALNTGVLVAAVLDIVNNGMPIAVLDTSATCHMPDVLEMPYRPGIWNAGQPGEKKYTFRLAGLSCLAGDVIGDYSFDTPLKTGDKLVFTDMAHYTMVKTNTFNGVLLPSICTYDSRTGEYRIIREFGYEDFKRRLS